MRQLDQNELQALIIGTFISTDQSREGVRSNNRGEQFLADGQYVHLAHRAPIGGRYRFKGAEVCITIVTLPDREDCRVILSSESGGLYFARSGEAADRRPWPIVVERWAP